MSTCSLPGFTAERSLYPATGHYRTVHPAAGASALAGVFQLAMVDDGGEVIVIVDDWPPDPWQPPNWGGHDGGGAPPAGPSGGGPGGGGGGGGTPQPPKRKCRRAVGRVEVDGVLWRKECRGQSLTSCCSARANECRQKCPGRGTPQSAEQCLTECSQSRKVCVDGRHPDGPEVCSLP
ncbi:MAG TPA: hypothetical protein VF310_03435 [Vicinamibacteria bacterium]